MRKAIVRRAFFTGRHVAFVGRQDGVELPQNWVLESEGVQASDPPRLRAEHRAEVRLCIAI
jgi:hypothetical protein